MASRKKVQDETRNDEPTDDELESLMEQQFKQQKRPDYRRSDGYERKRITRGAVVDDGRSDGSNDGD